MEKDILIKFGSRIRELRLGMEWFQETLADKTGFHRTYIGMIERGERNLSLKNIEIFASSFGLTISDLLKF
ncbi:MAG: helix-turn-helix transcriptional regulator [Bacteroidota bacterium]|nr:helix-turn-helix transcriptional regulator [Bacteroidota bacterium]